MLVGVGTVGVGGRKAPFEANRPRLLGREGAANRVDRTPPDSPIGPGQEPELAPAPPYVFAGPESTGPAPGGGILGKVKDAVGSVARQ